MSHINSFGRHVSDEQEKQSLEYEIKHKVEVIHDLLKQVDDLESQLAAANATLDRLREKIERQAAVITKLEHLRQGDAEAVRRATPPVATADTLEELAEIGRKAYNDEHYKACREIDTGAPVDRKAVIKRSLLAQVTAILRAAKPEIDLPAHDMIVFRSGETQIHGSSIESLNSRIRYTVALPDAVPADLPSAEEIYRECVPAEYPSGRAIVTAILAHLRPWLRDPVAWDLDVTEEEIENLIYNGPQERAKFILRLVRSRIRPVFDCATCAEIRDRLAR